ncbi:MAG: ornithine cyclodeaminase family protein [Gemmatimonadetes bacterium]|nr:ornithine cyclodeaminase family protein [Gemmatimonadota bacterium]NNM07129.1 ornithine cyclodeaminase family protein [Gemmatimonadota bacterium]
MSKPVLRYLSREDVESLSVPMEDIIEAVEAALREKGEGTAEMPPKPGVHPKTDSFIHAMPAYLAGLQAAGLKWVSGFPQNPQKGLPYISGLFVLNDVETGLPLSVMDCAWITGVRTGAASAVAAKFLARPDSRTMGVVACGLQGRTNLEAMACLFPLERIFAYDIDRSVSERYSSEMGEKLGLEVTPVYRLQDAVKGLDLVVTSGPILKEPTPSIPAGWLAPGSFACPLDFDSFWTGDAFREVDRLATDDLGQLSYYRGVGYFSDTPEPDADLGDIVAGRVPGREGSGERTMSLNLGLAIEDVASARLIYEKALENGVGTELPL